MPKSTRGLSRALSASEPKERTKRLTAGPTEHIIEQSLSILPQESDSASKAVEHQGTKNLKEFRTKERAANVEAVKRTSIDKHVESIRYKVVYAADKLADELTHAVSKKTKKDKEYIKGLVWSFGTLYDKLTAVQSDAQMVALPNKLLENVTAMLKAQAELIKASHVAQAPLSSLPKGEVLDVAPATEDHVRSTPDEVLRTAQDATEHYVSSHDVRTSPQRSDTDEKLRT